MSEGGRGEREGERKKEERYKTLLLRIKIDPNAITRLALFLRS